MGLEIERKFLVVGDAWRASGRPRLIVQGYLAHDPERVVRIRTAGDQAFITVKGITRNASRSEFEYPIPLLDARQMLSELCLKPLIAKTRYEVGLGDLTWEVDVYEASHASAGMSHLASAMGLSLVEKGWRVHLARTSDLTNDCRSPAANLASRPQSNALIDTTR